MKIYTRTGDDGTTGLFGGGRVPKDHPRVLAYGAVDELSAHLGFVRAQGIPADLDTLLAQAQADLFALGADLATPAGVKAEAKVRRLANEDAQWLEEAIDRLEGDLQPLQSFILPGGSGAAAAAHIARAVCRRAERLVVTLAREAPIGPGVLIYLNRLADFLFVFARALNRRAQVAEEPWNPRSA